MSLKIRIFNYIVLALFSASLGFFYSYHYPQFKMWGIVQLAEASDKYLNMRIFASDLNLTFWPLGISLKEVKLLPRGELAKTLAPISAKRLSAGISTWNLFTGKRNIYSIRAEEPRVTVILKKSEANPVQSRPSFKIPTGMILNIPIHRAEISKMNLKFRSDDAQLISEIADLDLNVEHEYLALSLSLSTREMKIKKRQAKGAFTRIGLESKLILEPRTLQISHLTVEKNNSVLVGAGILEGRLSEGQIEKYSAKLRSKLDMDEIRAWVLSFFPQLSLPLISGEVDLHLDLTQAKDAPLNTSGQITTRGLKISKFSIGDLRATANYDQKKLTLQELQLSNPAGRARLFKGELLVDEKMPFSAEINVEQVELAALLQQLGLKRPDLHLLIHGGLPCKGELKPVMITCTGTLNGEKFSVWNDENGENSKKPKPAKTIVKLKSFSATGTVTIDSEAVRPKANLQVGTSKGYAEGKVDYKKGFEFSYKSKDLKLSDAEDIAGLDLEGSAEVEGTTSGDSDYAIIDMKVKARDFWIKDFGVGNGVTDVSYRKGILNLNNISGAFKSSRYIGNTSIDLRRSTINAQFTSPYLDAADIQSALERKAKLPFQVSGPGSGKATVQGPLEFTQLTYDVQSQVNRGVIAGEIVDQAHFNVHARKGHVKADRVEIIKGGGSISLQGDGYPDGNIDTRITGKNLALETFDVFSAMPVTFTGSLNFTTSMKGYVFKPVVRSEGTITQSSLSQQTVPDSNFRLFIDSQKVEGQGEFFGKTIMTEFVFPLAEKQRFKFNFATQKWNFSPLLNIISGSTKQQGYEAELTSTVKLESHEGGFETADGRVLIDSIRIRRGALELFNAKPLRILVRNGIIQIEHFFLQGDNTQLLAESRPPTGKVSHVSLSGSVDMSLLAFLTPFLQELRGIFSISSQINLGDGRFEVLGSAFVNRGYVKLKEFPHPLEQLKADVLFNQKKIIINTFSGQLAGGTLSADGHVLINGYKNFPTQINLWLDDTTLKVPQGTTTRGQGRLAVTGNWFPYLLSGSYSISEGLMDRNFQNDQDNVVRRSSFLPKILLQDVFEPVRLDISTFLPPTFKVKNSLVDFSVTGQIKILGTPNVPVLSGELQALKGGKLYFRDTPFEIQTAIIRFDNPQEINPTLYITARSRVQSTETDTTTTAGSGEPQPDTDRRRTREYEVNLLLQGTSKNMRLALTSQPPLEEHDIISLLALGVTSQQLERRQGTGQDQVTEVGTALLSQNLKIKNKWVDVKVAPANSTGDTRVADQKVVLSRQWTPKMSTAVSRTIRTNVTDARLQYQLNDNVSAILNWEGRQAEETNKDATKKESDTFGLGLEYGVEFK